MNRRRAMTTKEMRWDHDTMRDAAMRPVTGPGSTDTLAASGGLELPAHESHPMPVEEHGTPEPIPGERDASTLTWRQPGAVGGRFSGADTPSADPSDVMDAATIHDRELEGGGKGARGQGGKGTRGQGGKGARGK